MTAADLKPLDRAILEHLLLGKRPKEIGPAMDLHPDCVRTRMWRLMRLLGVRTSLQLGAWCERHGIREKGAG